MILVAGNATLRSLLRNRAKVFPLIPVVHVANSQSFLRTIQPLPADVVGVPVEYDYSGTIEQALRWHPRASHLVVVTGSASLDRTAGSRLRDEVTRFKDRATVEFLAGLPTSAVRKRLGQLGENNVVFTRGYFADGEDFSPREDAGIMAAAATGSGMRPIRHIHWCRHRRRPDAELTNWYGQASCTAGCSSFITGLIPIRLALALTVNQRWQHGQPNEAHVPRRRSRALGRWRLLSIGWLEADNGTGSVRPSPF